MTDRKFNKDGDRFLSDCKTFAIVPFKDGKKTFYLAQDLLTGVSASAFTSKKSAAEHIESVWSDTFPALRKPKK